MRIRLSEFKKIINKFLTETLEEMEQNEDIDRMNRAKDGYGETEFEEAAPPPSAPQSAKPRIKDKSQMQGVGPRPTMANAFRRSTTTTTKERSFNCFYSSTSPVAKTS